MSFERSPIAETAAALPNQSIPIMREDREIDPYRASKPRIPADTGQSGISSEQAAPVAPKAPEETIALSPQMAALARKEQKFRQEQMELKKLRASIDAEKAEVAELKALKAKLAAKDYSGLDGQIKYEDYTNYLIEKESKLTPEQQAVKKLSDEVEAMKTAQKDDITKRFDAAVNERRKAVKSLVETNPEFSSIKELKAEEAVVKHILDTWENDQIDLSPEEAAKEVEDVLIDRAAKWSALSKLKAKEAAPVVEDKKNLPPLKAPIKTLTNNMAATGEIKRSLKPLSQMSDTERYAEARRRAEEKLKLQGK